MRRGYTGNEIAKLMDVFLKHGVRISFHALLGFPSETRTELNDTLRFIRDTDFQYGNCFIYAAPKYAPSATMPGGFSNDELSKIAKYATNYLRKSKLCSVEVIWPEGISTGTPLKLLVTKNDKTPKKLPRIIGMFLSCFIPSKENRQYFRNKFVKDKK